MGPLFVGFNSKIRPRGTKSEAPVVIVNLETLETQKESSNIGLIGTLSAGPIICEDSSLFYAGRQCQAGGVVEKMKKINENCVLSFSPNSTKPPTRVRQKRKTRGEGTTALNFRRLSLGDLYVLVKAMFARATSKGAGSRPGERRGRGVFI